MGRLRGANRMVLLAIVIVIAAAGYIVHTSRQGVAQLRADSGDYSQRLQEAIRQTEDSLRGR